MSVSSSPTPPLSWSVIATLAWFGARQRPLRADEVARLLLANSGSEPEVRKILESDTRIIERSGYFSLQNDDVRYPSDEALQWYRYKWWRLKVAVGILKNVPFIRLVGALQTVADRTAKQRSDIDIFIVIEHGRLYLTRTIVTLVLHVSGLRRHGTHVTDRVCLSWFASTAHLDLAPITFKPWDPLLVFLFAEMVPVLDDETYHNFVKTNQWIAEYLPGYAAKDVEIPEPTWLARFGEKVFSGKFGDFLEKRLMNWQQARITRNPKSDNPDVEIIATESMLKFHEKERRRVDRENWETKMEKFGCDPKLILR